MAALDKLLIKGIRSYNPNDSNTIEFTSPMTLIVGSNGTGKTTIIECLKYITTGNLPPNSRNGAFVYDPRLIREVDVKAQVKLSFMNTKGQRLVCSRTLQCTQKGSKTEQKTLESILYEEQKKEQAMNLKAGENELGHYFNISLSMLESVIFCHQDESTWPLSEPANVKKKFDDVFSSTKYSKALEALKVTKRNISTQIKLKYQELEYLYKLREKKNEMERRLDECSKELLMKKKKEEVLSKEHKTCSSLLEEIYRDIEKVESIKVKMHKKREEIERLFVLDEVEMSREEAEEVLTSNSISGLEEEVESCKEGLLVKEEKHKEHKKKKEVYEMHKQKINKLKEQKEKAEFLKREIEKDEERLLKEWEVMKKKMVNPIEELTTYEDTQGKSSCLEEIFQKIFGDFEMQMDAKRRKLERMEKEIEELKEEIGRKTHLISENKRLLEEFKCFEDDPSINIDDSYEDLIKRLKEHRLKEDLIALEKTQEELQVKYHEELKLSKEIYAMDQKNKRLEVLQREIGTTEIAKKRGEAKTQIERNKAKIKKLKGEMKERQEVKNKRQFYKEMLVNLRRRFEEMAKERKWNINWKENDKEIGSACWGEFLDLKLKEINSHMRIEDPDLIETIQKQLEDIRKMGGGAELVYSNLLKAGMKNKKCPVCKSHLKDPQEFKARLEKAISKAPENTKDKAKKLEGALRMACDYFEFKRQVEEIEEKISGLGEEPDWSLLLEENELSLLDCEEDTAHCEKILKFIEEYEDIREEIKKCPPVNLLETEEELKHSKKKVTSKKKEIEEIEKRIIDLEEKQKRILQVKEGRERLQKKREVERTLEGLEASVSKEKKILEEKEIISKSKKKIHEASRENLLKKRFLVEETLQKRREKISQLEEIKIEEEPYLDFDIEEYEKSKEEVYSVVEQLNVLKEDLRRAKELQGIAKRHIEHYHNKARREVLKKEIHKIVEAISRSLKKPLIEGDSSGTPFEDEFLKALKSKKADLEKKKEGLLKDSSLLRGEMNQLEVVKRQVIKEIEGDYKEVVSDYNKAYVSHKILDLSLKDIDKLISALDKAVLDFHSYKIEEVNKILKDLWMSSYKGNDIDYIELKSESLSNKTYSYRISQVKNGVELEMRGRCSAGQKMLASILVRLSLSQTFGGEFNVIALDEPTTNLDRENIESLALALLKIIKESKVQLLVITHDEEFVSLLSRESGEYFYRLTRNERGDSQIYRHSIY